MALDDDKGPGSKVLVRVGMNAGGIIKARSGADYDFIAVIAGKFSVYHRKVVGVSDEVLITITEGHLKGGRAAFGQFDPGAGNKIGINHHSDIGLVSGTNWFSPPSFNCFNGDVFSFDWKVFDEFDEFSFGGIAIEEGNAPLQTLPRGKLLPQ